MPPNLMLPTGSVRRTNPSTMGTVTLTGLRITQRVSLPHMPFSISSLDLVLRMNFRPRASTRGPRMASIAGRIVMAVSAASATVAMDPYATDFRKPCGNSSRPPREATIIVAENTTVRPAVMTVRRTACGVVCPSPSSSRNLETMKSP